MLFLRSWLEDYIDLTAISNEQIASIITQKSSEVEEIINISDWFDKKVVVAKVTNFREHSNADKLKIFDADMGSLGKTQIVTGAGNINENDFVPVATVGCILPDFVIESRMLRGEKSEGMVCGKSELLLESQNSSGVWILNSEIIDLNNALGQSICEVLPEYFNSETIFDIGILPNKIGVFGSYLGFALELAMLFEKRDLLTQKTRELYNGSYLKSLFGEKLEMSKTKNFNFTDQTGIANKFCLFDLKVGNDFVLDKIMKRRMFLTKINLIGGLTDISNYLLFDIGQPNHFFSKVKLQALSVTEFRLQTNDIPVEFSGLGQLKKKILPVNTKILTDQNNNILALPGVSGGYSTKMEIDETEAVVEIANFDNEAIARSSFALKYRSEGGKIWAGGVNESLIMIGLARLIQICSVEKIKILCLWDKTNLNNTGIDDFLNTIKIKPIQINLLWLASKLDNRGLEYWEKTITEKLNIIGAYSDGFLYTEKNYSNIQNQNDVFEEIVRLIGFQNLSKNPIVSYSDQLKSSYFYKLEKLKQIFVNFGCNEVILRPFIQEKHTIETDKSMQIVQPYRSYENYLRDSLLPSLAIAIDSNLKRGEKTPRIFEVNKIHTYSDNNKQNKLFADALIVCKEPYLATSLVHKILVSIGLNSSEIHKKIVLDKIGQGYLYNTEKIQIKLIELSKSFKKDFSISLSKTIWWISVDLTNWNYEIDSSNKFVQESIYPGISRSYSLLIPKNLSFGNIHEVIRSIDLSDVKFLLTPKERFNNDDNNSQDILNFEIEFESLYRNITNEEIVSFEENMLSKLYTLGEISKR